MSLEDVVKHLRKQHDVISATVHQGEVKVVIRSEPDNGASYKRTCYYDRNGKLTYTEEDE